MSTFNTGNIQGTNVQVGDDTEMTVNAGHAAGPANMSLDELNRRVEQSEQSLQEMAEAIEQLRAELLGKDSNRDRIRRLVGTLTKGAGTVAAVAEGVEKVRQAFGAL